MNKTDRMGVKDRVYKKIKEDVIEGKLEPGKRLKEVDLAKNMEASRTPIREALARLEKEGLVAPLPHRGYKVAELNKGNIEEVFGVREVLESYAGELATHRITWESIQELEAVLEQSEKQSGKGNWDSILELNTRFHETITVASGNRLVLSFLDQLNNHILRYRSLLIKHTYLFSETLKDHQSILHFLKIRDHQAVHHSISEHVRKTKEIFLSMTSDELI